MRILAVQAGLLNGKRSSGRFQTLKLTVFQRNVPTLTSIEKAPKSTWVRLLVCLMFNYITWVVVVVEREWFQRWLIATWSIQSFFRVRMFVWFYLHCKRQEGKNGTFQTLQHGQRNTYMLYVSRCVGTKNKISIAIAILTGLNFFWKDFLHGNSLTRFKIGMWALRIFETKEEYLKISSQLFLNEINIAYFNGWMSKMEKVKNQTRKKSWISHFYDL